jgi:beta-lactamase superfamily II metal-dependent hydrolase
VNYLNENSLALLITYGSDRFFFPGDYETYDADADVLKIPIMDK